MSSTRQVPETSSMSRDELSADDAWQALRHHGGWTLVREAFLRFRYGDGFSHARALGLQLCLAIVPFLIALSGLAGKLGVKEGGDVVADTVLALTPGASEQVVHDLLAPGDRGEDAGELALALGLITGLLALATAMAQIERGANRIYGVERDRPAHLKYARAAILAAVAGIPALTGFLMLVAGDAMGASVRTRYPGWGDTVESIWTVARWPASILLVVTAVAAIFRFAPRRRQPAFSWLLFGAALSTALWWGISALLALYVQGSGAFGATYGALTGIMALLLWANATGIVLFLGIAFSAQLEAYRVGVPGPIKPDTWAPPVPADR
ncbi:YihY/virulence factor BrkB family protein [Dactylosporangium vinaceum]|uniref:YihY/virulence factor BrkB family protein n=1 Tax=Dactylosporangium vinaceum TaxID=53362 RepID=A0ABV5M7Y0_9ACTN|nr:YihY/virulence factor BrkB family protein [Dactylosporangium vinaceum]UAB98108.1 YihY/virulence factor BrkB family protein [Dactylosporangium vinaceum]